MEDIENNLREIMTRIKGATLRSGRSPEEIRLIVVTKNQPLDKIREAMRHGVRAFGENTAQEFMEKRKLLGDSVEWHFIGHLQTNKVPLVVGNVSMIHSVDSLKLARKIGERAVGLGIIQDVLLQVNVSGEESKYGLDVDSAKAVFRSALELKGLRLRGLMTMAPYAEDKEIVRPVFRGLKRLQGELKTEVPEADLSILSMGMTGDFEVAIEEGANMIRIGSGIFGEVNVRAADAESKLIYGSLKEV